MIKFFRNIRKRLLSENRFSRYLIYAIGEIFLVVIGILIALQINNWNENNKNIATLQSSLDALQTNLKEDIENMHAHIEFNQTVLDDINYIYKILLQHEYREKPFSEIADSMFNLGLEISFNISNTAFQTMESGGHFQLLKNQALSRSIYKYYNFIELIEGQIKDNNQFVQLLLEPFIFSEMEIRAFPPVQKEQLKPDKRPLRMDNKEIIFKSIEFENLVISRMWRLESENRQFKEGINKAQQLIDEIRNEIN